MSVRDPYFANEKWQYSYYPSPVSRKMPKWLSMMRLWPGHEAIGDLMHEVYQAVFGGQYRLAAMGIRAVLEQVMILKVGDREGFIKNLDAFQREGFISQRQRESILPTLEVGHAAMHRAYEPTEEDLYTALDVVEGVLAPIFGHADEAKNMGKRVPSKSKRISS
ncbi:DUF4145 domain-containing protein [Bradyrhizobium yuanmingense]|uniref:DUF4145 domain-containing protein n=1 Tax=Bradyrhizobium yuanmingense TaxID=108015 RepID=UPI0021A811D6|nr:DUF4145 domain-containing protein [Bradyrhizobium sp. CB1024]UWU86164.1 DUF4145 domain-containing protein [Bradyrhizobium sp. CB1024]